MSSDLKLEERIASLTPAQRLLLDQRRNASRVYGYQQVARGLRSCGITHLYCVSAVPSDNLPPACAAEQIRPIGVYNQSAAVSMALAQNYQAGKLVAAVMVSTGPAVSNAMTGLLVASDNGWPVLVVGSNQDSFQRLDVAQLTGSVSKRTIEVHSGEQIVSSIHNAYHTALCGRPGPVFVDIHADALNQQCKNTAMARPVFPGPPTLDAAKINQLADVLLKSHHPVLLLGKGIRWSVDPKQLQLLVEKLDLAFITSPMGRGFIADDHPLCFNHARAALQSQADTVLMLGARLNWIFRHGAEIATDAQVLRVDIEPAADDAPHDAALNATVIKTDAGDFVARLLEAVHQRGNALNSKRRKQINDWHAGLRNVASANRASVAMKTQVNSTPLSPYRMMETIRVVLPRDAILISEGNVSMRVAQHVIPAYQPASRMDAGSNGCMGIGIPFAIGAKLARPERKVVVVAGDYGFSLSAMEMEVCVRHKIPIVVIVANNQGNNGSLKQNFFPPDYPERVSMFQPELEYNQIMQMFGGKGSTVADASALHAALSEALDSGQPSCINVLIDPHTALPNAWGEQSQSITSR